MRADCKQLEQTAAAPAAVYDQIGEDYDCTRGADPYIASRLAHHLQILPGAHYLDLACGTGNYTVALRSNHGGEWTGVDASSRMITNAQMKTNSVGWLVADCNRLPFSSDEFSGAICTLAIHHFGSLPVAFKEVYRVIKQGRFVIFTATPEQMQRCWLCEYFPQALSDSMQRMPSLAQVTSALEKAGFEHLQTEPYVIQENLQDFFLYSGKHTPQLYLDPRVRSGISTFALLANHLEVEAGCKRLAADIESGRIGEIRARYRNNDGDYLFVTATKSAA